jgi:alkylation response protein AidB-like acyl-CoA dehydrogenase
MLHDGLTMRGSGYDRVGMVAARFTERRVRAVQGSDGGWRLTGIKRWCSGAHACTHALVTAHAPDGGRLFAVDLSGGGVRAGSGSRKGPGMAGSGTEDVEFAAAPAVAVGAPRAYLNRIGFWYGAIGVAACWYGGAVGIGRPLWEAARSGALDPHGQAHLGAVDGVLGPRPLATDATHSRRVTDLTVYLRQSHAERDLAVLGNLAAGAAWWQLW